MDTSVIRFELAYNGTPYHGWQIQKEPITVQGELHRVLSTILQEPAWVNGASRTDAGVHAWGQVVSLPYPDAFNKPSPYTLQRAMNGMLPPDICVLRIEHVDQLDTNGRLFHARHSGRGKRYRYTIWPHRIPNPFMTRTAWRPRRAPDHIGWERAQEAATRLLGTHDFAGFRASGCEAETTVRTLHRVEVIPPTDPGTPAYVVVEGTSFLKYMVRIIVGTLMDIACGRRPIDLIDTVL
ncbi:MAG: tRNA pseudouridine synthase A, partial [Myxococcota bacterium]